MRKKVAIIGGGAAGVFCGLNLGKDQRFDICIFEKTNELLKKVRISGGGRCNVTHRYISNAQFSKNYPRGQGILKSNFEQFSSQDMQLWLESRGVKLKTEADGRIFPITDNSETIIHCFENELRKLNIPVRFNSEITQIEKKNDKFSLSIKDKREEFDFVVISTGGAQKERDLDLYKSLEISTIRPVPSLFTFKIKDKDLTDLMGIAIPKASIRIMQSDFKEMGDVLITHWGLSGPAILKLSAWGAFLLNERNYHFQIAINWVGELNEDALIKELELLSQKHSQGKVINHKLEKFPQRFWEYLLLKSDIDISKKWTELSKKNKNKLSQTITNSTYEIQGKTTYKEEFVTAGGIELSAFYPSTMESKNYPNLYFIGEITNIDGITGGFNFQNAWTSAVVAAKSIQSK